VERALPGADELVPVDQVPYSVEGAPAAEAVAVAVADGQVLQAVDCFEEEQPGVVEPR
jgi:hypothetical protein